MKMLFCAGTSPLSKMIMWGLSEPCSHFAILFDDKIVFHSDLTGVHLSWYNTFLETHSVVEEIDCGDDNLDLQEAVYQNIINTYNGDMYDYGAFAYFIYRAALLKCFKMPLPEQGLFGSKKMFLCTEMAGTLPDEWVPASIKARDLGMVSPYQLWLLLQPSILDRQSKAQGTSSP